MRSRQQDQLILMRIAYLASIRLPHHALGGVVRAADTVILEMAAPCWRPFQTRN